MSLITNMWYVAIVRLCPLPPAHARSDCHSHQFVFARSRLLQLERALPRRKIHGSLSWCQPARPSTS
eukprot:13859116-Alexandrium_andersonii.AAC.1